jgi:drug/metabolite transporter (DMT)-like permease
MKNTFLYIITVLIWGTTWFAIEFQLGQVAVEVSLVYRFGLAAILILVISKLRGLNLSFSKTQHLYIALLGLFNFCLNYFVLYEAQNYLTSAMTSIGFSMLLLVNIINTRVFFGKKITAKTYFGAALGIAGIVVLFWPELENYQNSSSSLYGLGLVLLGVIFASLGNMVSVRNSTENYPVFQTSGWGMLYGTVFLALIAWVNDAEFSISFETDYLLSLGYLAIFGTVIAFYSYFYLLKSIGPEKASYSIVMFPVVAVVISSLYEGFAWTPFTIYGFCLVASGNLLMLIPVKKLRSLASIITRRYSVAKLNIKTEHCPTDAIQSIKS